MFNSRNGYSRGRKGGKVFLTLLFRQSKFMLIYLMENKTMELCRRSI